jgi:hypothetical protein
MNDERSEAERNPKGNGYQATVTLPDGASMSSAESYPSIREATTAAAIKLLALPERIAAIKDGTP